MSAAHCRSQRVAVANLIRQARARESSDALSHGEHAQIDLVGSFRDVPIRSFARLGNLDVALPTQRAPKEVTAGRVCRHAQWESVQGQHASRVRFSNESARPQITAAACAFSRGRWAPKADLIFL